MNKLTALQAVQNVNELLSLELIQQALHANDVMCHPLCDTLDTHMIEDFRKPQIWNDDLQRMQNQVFYIDLNHKWTFKNLYYFLTNEAI